MFYLGVTASEDDLGTTFYAVQAVELVAGATNITLLARNTRDGLRLSGRLRRPRPPDTGLRGNDPSRHVQATVSPGG